MSDAARDAHLPGVDDGHQPRSGVSTHPGRRRQRAPLDPTTYAELEEIAARYPQARSGLLPMLHLVQSVEGQVTSRGIEACAEILGISAAEVSGVATFYTMYKRRPVGDYHVGVCTNTLCAIMGGDLIFERLKDHLDIGNDETTDDGKVTLEHVECNAACDFAPVMMVNWEFMDNMTPESAVPARRRPALRRRGALDPRAAAVHLARGRAGARRLPRRPGRRGPVGRSRLAGRAGHRPRAGLDGADGASEAQESAARGRRRPRATPTARQGRGKPRGRAQPSRTPKVEESAAEAKHEDNPAEHRVGTTSDRHC